MALAQILLGLSQHFWLSAIIAAPIGFAILTQNLISNSLLQHRVPDHLRGRVMSFYSMMLIGTVPIGAIICGGVAEKIGLPLTLIIGGALCLAGAAVISLWDRSDRKRRAPASPSQL